MPVTAPPAPLNPPADHHALVRHIGLFSLIAYGVGDMVGSGIYSTIGDAAGLLGNAVWLGFVVAMVAALLTGLSYASLASRYPRSAGAAYVTQRAFGKPFLAYVIGLGVTASGLTSMAAASNAFAKAFASFSPALPIWITIVVFLLCLCAINLWGIREAMWLNILCTFVEVGGLIFLIVVGLKYWGSVDLLQTVPAADGSTAIRFSLLMSASVLMFYSFVGFEDMLNISEEVKNPEKTMPWGMIVALAVVTLLYISVSITAVSVVGWKALSDNSGAAMSTIMSRSAPWLPSWVYIAITLFAVANTALINYIMGSRLMYGMARQGLLPAALGRIHPTRRTPHVAILTLLVIVLGLALSGSVKELASATALLLLSSFTVVNCALVVLKLRPGEAKGQFEIPVIVPILGAVVCVSLIIVRVTASRDAGLLAPSIAAGIIAFITILFFILRPKLSSEPGQP